MINLVWTFILKVSSIYFIFLPANTMEQCTPKRGNSFCDRWKKRLMNDYTIFCHEIRNTTLPFIQVGFIKSHRRKPRVLCFLYFHIEWTINPCDDTLEATTWFIALDIRIYTDIMSFKLQFCYSKCLSQCQMRKLLSYESKTRKKYVIIGVFGVVITITEWQLGKL